MKINNQSTETYNLKEQNNIKQVLIKSTNILDAFRATVAAHHQRKELKLKLGGRVVNVELKKKAREHIITNLIKDFLASTSSFFYRGQCFNLL